MRQLNWRERQRGVRPGQAPFQTSNVLRVRRSLYACNSSVSSVLVPAAPFWIDHRLEQSSFGDVSGNIRIWLIRHYRIVHGRPVRVEFGDIETVEPKVRIRMAIGETAAEAVEQRLRSWVLKLPGSR